MEKQDARTLPSAAQDQLRRQSIQLHKDGMSFVKIALLLGINRNSPAKWWQLYLSGGMKAITSKRRGITTGMNRTLTKEQEAQVQKSIIDKTPDQYKLTFALWTRQAVRDLIRLLTGIDMPIRTVGEYLKRWGFTPQKPLKRAYEQRPEAVKKWKEEEFPAIHARAMEEDAEIHWGDETGLRSDGQYGRSYAPKGHTPEIRLSAKRTSVSMISTVTNRGKVRFMMLDAPLNAQVLITFLKRLIRDAGRKVFLILDNLRDHHAKIVQAWLEEHKEEIEVFYLPSYSPELNPDEYLNGHLKSGVHSQPPFRSNEKLKAAVVSYMRKLQRRPSTIMNYFKHHAVRYAA